MKNILTILFIFTIAYFLAAFSNWELDCSKWGMLARWGVIWGTTIVSFIYIFLKNTKQ